MLNNFYIEDHVKKALEEDIGFGDITTDYLIPEDKRITAKLNSREDAILCGIDIVEMVFKTLSNDVKIQKFFKDGDKVKKGDTLAIIEGPARVVLIGERTALNYVQRLSGIATETNKYQEAIGDNKARITDTRKTTPGFRMFEKYAVFTGGARLYRFNLSDCVMIKDNHIQFAGSITNAVNEIRKHLSHTHKIEVECDTIEQVKECFDKLHFEVKNTKNKFTVTVPTRRIDISIEEDLIEEVGRIYGYRTTVFTSDTDEDSEALVNSIITSRCDGAIVFGSQLTEEDVNKLIPTIKGNIRLK